ncbi:MAG: hypothetical protein RL020_1760 [Pseudomonadota bacterium]
MSASLLSGLNPEQLAAVTLGTESALVLAGAGSGKTRVLTTRIAYLIQTGATSPAGLLAVTFTNKAAKEMLLRLTSMMPINTRGMWVGTFHGLCNRLLRAHFREASLPQLFQILDVQDQLAVIKRLLKATNTDEEKYPPRQVQFFIAGNKDKGLRANAVEAHDPFTRKLVELYAMYDEQCNREGVVDFAELLLRSYELLTRNASFLDHYRDRFKFILVDEFQDTNRLQYNWIKLLAGEKNCVFAVGDDDQSIYAFRGAEVGNMRDLERDFHIKKIIKLEQNYRSQGNILDSANSLIKNNNSRLGKNLWTAAGEGEKVRIFEAASDMDEAQYIIDEANALHREGMNYSDMALLYRSNAQSRVLEHALFRAGIGYRVYGGLRFFERQEIKHALAYLRLAGNQDDDTAFTRVVNFPTRGIGARSIEQLQEAAKVRGVSLMQAASDSTMSGRAGVSLQNFVGIIDSLKSGALSLPLPELMEDMLHKSGLREHYENEKDGADRLENLNELVTAAALFQEEYRSEDTEETSTPLASFLAHASLEAGEHEAGAGQDALQLMTVHAAKGLEFHAVFVSGVEEGLFPHENSISEADGIEEERRLMYVAITRARQRLYLSHAQQRMLHGQIRYGIVSRFIDEIPEELTHRIVLRHRATGFNAAPTFDLDAKPYWNKATQPANVYGASIASGMPFNIGQSVNHAKFGEGVVVNCEGRGNDARVQVKFREAGIKWLALEYANLSTV